MRVNHDNTLVPIVFVVAVHRVVWLRLLYAARPMTQTQTLIDSALAHLNTDPRNLFALTYNPTLNAWQVLRIAKLDTKDGGEPGAFYGTCYVSPHGTSHQTANAALSDAIKLSIA